MKEQYGYLAGRYEKSSDVNCRSSYVRNYGKRAIWLNADNHWMIGNFEDLGESWGTVILSNRKIVKQF